MIAKRIKVASAQQNSYQKMKIFYVKTPAAFEAACQKERKCEIWKSDVKREETFFHWIQV